MNKNFRNMIDERKKLIVQVDKQYIEMAKNINKRLSELNTKESFHKEFLKASAMDIAGETVRNFFDTSNYNITVDQLMKRILEFNYENEYDPMEQYKKNLYNLENSRESIENLKIEAREAEKIFTKREVEKENGKIKKEYEDKALIEKGKKEYRNEKKEENNYNDEVGNAKSDTLQVDHVQPLATAKINKKYIKEEGIDRIKEFYNSEDNFALLGSTANQCKGDVKVLDKDGNDITYKASADEMTDAIVKKLEGGKNRKKHTTQKLKDDGILDENGKVKEHIKKKIKKDIKKSQIKESKVILKNANYKEIGKDATKETGRQLAKIVAGQIIYYVVPPIVYEIKESLNKKNDKDSILEELSKKSGRVVDYILSKKSEILSKILDNGLKNFFKNFFDIIISILKDVVKKIFKLVKKLILTVIDAIKILLDKKKSFSQKMDALLQLISGFLVGVVCEILFEYIEKQFAIPEMFLMPIQMIVSVLATNFIMLAIKKADFFNVAGVLKVEKIKMIFEEENKKREEEFERALMETNEINNNLFRELQLELINLRENIKNKNLELESIKNDLERSFDIFGMNLDLNSKLASFYGIK